MSEVGTTEYFMEQLLLFREMMGSKQYWEISDNKLDRKIDLAFNGLFHIYVNTDKISDEERILMDATIIEFQHRKTLMDTLRVKEGNHE